MFDFCCELWGGGKLLGPLYAEKHGALLKNAHEATTATKLRRSNAPIQPPEVPKW